MEDDAVRWSVKVSKSTDTSLRSHLARKGLKKGDLSKFIEEAVRWRVFQQAAEDVKARNANVSQEEIEAAIDEALTAIRAERFGPRA
jgi:Ribbon-helix-helix domain